MQAYFKSQFLPENECFVSINDRSFRFGDGVFETMLVCNGRMYDFARHLQRLKNGLAAFKIALDVSHVESLCQTLIEKNALTQGYIRIVVSRGENGANAVGYLPKDTKPYLVITSVSKPYPAFRGIKLLLSSQQASVHMPSKTNNALVYTLAMMEAEEQGCDNALLLNDKGQVCETASGNIFCLKDDVLYTPSTDLPLVPGTMRHKVLELWPGKKQEGIFPLSALIEADEVFMSNIASIIAPVISLASREWKVGNHTQQLRSLLDADIKQSCENTGN